MTKIHKRNATWLGRIEAGALLLLLPVLATAGPTDEQKCEGSKMQSAGKYAACAAKAEKLLVLKGDTTKYDDALAKCSDKLDGDYTKVESKGGCPTTGDAITVEEFMAACTLSVSGSLTDGTPLPDIAACSACADELTGCEDALAAALGGGLPATGQQLCYDTAGTVVACAGTGQDGEIQASVPRSFIDNGDGTITDAASGLMWEKHDDNTTGGMHSYRRTLTWENAFRKVRVLNGDSTGCIAAGSPDNCCTGAGTGTCTPFAGHSDWRLPNALEMYSLLNYSTYDPAISGEFHNGCTLGCTTATCACTWGSAVDYWTSTTRLDTPGSAIYVGFYNGLSSGSPKGATNVARAVRSAD
jgi:hypothetical protein